MHMPADFIIGAVVGAAAAAAASSRAGSAVRQGLLYGVGKALCVFDKVSEAAHGVARSAREAAASHNGTATVNGNPAATEAKAPTATSTGG
jgi:hypothetical protein